LTAVILFYCAVGVFALNNIFFDMWTLFLFGLIGFAMKALGFPIVPIILGVVLGSIAEKNLSQAFAITTDLTPFITRPWSLFFLTLGLFSIVFPAYQKRRGREKWTLAFIPLFLICLSPSVCMMEGVVRPVIDGLLALGGFYLLWKRSQEGWIVDQADVSAELPASDAPEE